MRDLISFNHWLLLETAPFPQQRSHASMLETVLFHNSSLMQVCYLL